MKYNILRLNILILIIITLFACYPPAQPLLVAKDPLDNKVQVQRDLRCLFEVEDGEMIIAVVEQRIKSVDSSVIILRDFPFSMDAILITGSGDSIIHYTGIDWRYNMGYNLGTIYAPCPSGYNPPKRVISEGKEYLGSGTFHWASELDIVEIYLQLSIYAKEGDRIRKRKIVLPSSVAIPDTMM